MEQNFVGKAGIEKAAESIAVTVGHHWGEGEGGEMGWNI